MYKKKREKNGETQPINENHARILTHDNVSRNMLGGWTMGNFVFLAWKYLKRKSN